jgi:hypothetical protein
MVVSAVVVGVVGVVVAVGAVVVALRMAFRTR